MANIEEAEYVGKMYQYNINFDRIYYRNLPDRFETNRNKTYTQYIIGRGLRVNDSLPKITLFCTAVDKVQVHNFPVFRTYLRCYISNPQEENYTVEGWVKPGWVEPLTMKMTFVEDQKKFMREFLKEKKNELLELSKTRKKLTPQEIFQLQRAKRERK